MSWSDLGAWWISELETDPAYSEVVTPLLVEILQPMSGARYLDLGCGEGRVMRALAERGVVTVGIDLNERLASEAGVAVVGELPQIPFAAEAFDGVYSVLTLEHVADQETLFAEALRVTQAGGTLAIVVNHPVWTAPGSTPITDTDGEVLWRPGEYFATGTSEIPADNGTITFYHRSTSDLLNAAATAGWALRHMIEQPNHQFADQAGIPRLMACRWART